MKTAEQIVNQLSDWAFITPTMRANAVGLIQRSLDAASAEMRERCAALANDYPEEAWDLGHAVFERPRNYVVDTCDQIKAAICALPLTNGGA